MFNLLALAIPVSAGTASWSAESIPSPIGCVLGPAGIDVRDIAVAAGGAVIYAVPGDSIADKVAYKSTSAGASWKTLDINIEADLVAVAPDDTSIVAIANSSTPEVYLSIDGGSTWVNLGTPQETIFDETALGSFHDITDSGGGDGAVESALTAYSLGKLF